ncbi:MAG: hypothetical protein ACRCVT_02015 [Leadbetterella sp.]
MIRTLLTLVVLVGFMACQTDKGNERLSDASEKLGKSTSTVYKGIKKGVENATKINIELTDVLKNKGLSLGKVKLDSKNGGKHNVLNVYMIFDKTFKKSISLKVYDADNVEVGRTKQLIIGKEGEAKYIDFEFDKNTNIDRDHKVVME